MAKFQGHLDERLRGFISEQKVFFTATAPSVGRINLSPKGLDTFRCIDDRTVAYLDLTGSGNESAAHVFENGRMTIMFCSFSKNPLILRLYGKARVVRPTDEEWDPMHHHFPTLPGERQIIILAIESIQTSCGFGVPMFEGEKERYALVEWAIKKGDEGLIDYRETKNSMSIDGRETYPVEQADKPRSQ
jgi:hypothetical protein